jgi:ABC-2 type transport system ATP-binding protein
MGADNGAVVVEGVTKAFGRSRALDDVSLEIPVGEIFGFIGPNGSGKTTLIRVILDLLRPTEGRISVFGNDSRHMGTAARQEIGYLPGTLTLPQRVTGGDYLMDQAAIRRIDCSARIRELGDRLHAELNKQIGDMSLGHRRKIGLIAAFMHSPRLLILDEPTSGLDPLVQQEFRAMTQEARDAGTTVFLSSHILDEVQHVASSVAVVNRGRIVTAGRIDDLIARLLRTLTVTFADEVDLGGFTGIPHVESVGYGNHDRRVVTFTLRGPAGDLLSHLVPLKPLDIHGREADLEDVFLDFYRNRDVPR